MSVFSTQATGLALRLEQAQDVVLADGALNVADNGTGGVVHELDADLSDATTGAGATEDLGDLGEFNGLLLGVLRELMRM
ncbi:hypothetical protein BC938DRAFT_471993 [Jimgerdemannia flammicorona]|uniref:Uncharacterized protein n=1 Tax=Jimgerdemannia flammicorona TaxID=994334 RepID=A0A433Q6Y6_9FUNG|nr:hypothetical protein BC938DRAFT_471993 [Jimgerdemannia flammicorona]